MKKRVVNLKSLKLKTTHLPNWNNEFKSSLKIIIFEDLIADTIIKTVGHFLKPSDVMF